MPRRRPDPDVIRRAIYARIVESPMPRPAGARALRRNGALTAHEREARERAKPCRIFRGAGEVCERARCGHERRAHPVAWRQAA